MKKIALFGGSFDPIHTDHINIIKACLNDLKFDQVWIIPAYVNPFKNISTSSVNQRLEMISLAIKNLKEVYIKTYEIRNHSKSFTYDTVSYYKNKYSEYNFSFIMGSDQLDNFEKWDHFDQLIKTIDFKVFLRTKQINQKIINKYNLETFEFENNYLSSTKIRNLIDLNLQIKEVNDYINFNLMYLYERLESKMDEKRYFHSLNVGQMALNLARLHGVDMNKAFIAGTLHDIAKRWSENQLKQYLIKYNSALLKEPYPVWHSYVGAYHLKYDWLFNDLEIIDAVFKHTVADIKMSNLEKIIFVADKISIERNYKDVEKYRAIAYADLDLAFKELIKNQYDIAVKKHSLENIGIKLKQVYKYWIEEDH